MKHARWESNALWETGGIHSATTNEEGMGALRGRWLNPLADIMTGVAIIMRDQGQLVDWTMRG